MTLFEGKCPSCGKTYNSTSKGTVICDCWQYCPLCGSEMTPYTPDLTLKTYGINGEHELAILMVCARHSPPFFSTKKPVEVTIS